MPEDQSYWNYVTNSFVAKLPETDEEAIQLIPQVQSCKDYYELCRYIMKRDIPTSLQNVWEAFLGKI